MHLSTLRRFVGAMGGGLEIRPAFLISAMCGCAASAS